jgi:predicted transglutaminase-like cysteine proteinase
MKPAPLLALACLLAVDALAQPEERPLTKEELATIKRINRQVNAEIVWMSDLENYGVADRRMPEPSMQKLGPRSLRFRYGDCEDYVLTKLVRLIRAGIPKSRLQMARVSVPRASAVHAVLLVRHGPELLILDSYDNRIETMAKMEQRWGWRFLTPLARR